MKTEPNIDEFIINNEYEEEKEEKKQFNDKKINKKFIIIGIIILIIVIVVVVIIIVLSKNKTLSPLPSTTLKCSNYNLNVNQEKTGCEMKPDLEPNNVNCPWDVTEKQFRIIDGRKVLVCHKENSGEEIFVGIRECYKGSLPYYIPDDKSVQRYNHLVCFKPVDSKFVSNVGQEVNNPKTWPYWVIKNNKNIKYE